MVAEDAWARVSKRRTVASHRLRAVPAAHNLGHSPRDRDAGRASSRLPTFRMKSFATEDPGEEKVLQQCPEGHAAA